MCYRVALHDLAEFLYHIGLNTLHTTIFILSISCSGNDHQKSLQEIICNVLPCRKRVHEKLTTKSLNVPVQLHPGWQQTVDRVDISRLIALSANIYLEIKRKMLEIWENPASPTYYTNFYQQMWPSMSLYSRKPQEGFSRNWDCIKCFCRIQHV